jgi:hypothetical protein
MKYQVIRSIDKDDNSRIVDTKDTLAEAEYLADKLATEDANYKAKHSYYYTSPVFWIRPIGSAKT